MEQFSLNKCDLALTCHVGFVPENTKANTGNQSIFARDFFLAIFKIPIFMRSLKFVSWTHKFAWYWRDTQLYVSGNLKKALMCSFSNFRGNKMHEYIMIYSRVFTKLGYMLHRCSKNSLNDGTIENVYLGLGNLRCFRRWLYIANEHVCHQLWGCSSYTTAP